MDYIGRSMRPVVLLLVLAACSPAPAPVASSPEDPSNPRAAEGIDPTLAVRTMPASAAASGSAATAYQCPMHPEVTSDHPGRCPKCGMNLVPKK